MPWQSFISFRLWQWKPHGYVRLQNCDKNKRLFSSLSCLASCFLPHSMSIEHTHHICSARTLTHTERLNEDNDYNVNKYCGCFTVNLFSHFHLDSFLCSVRFFLVNICSDSVFATSRMWIRISHSIQFDLHLCDFLSSHKRHFCMLEYTHKHTHTQQSRRSYSQSLCASHICFSACIFELCVCCTPDECDWTWTCFVSNAYCASNFDEI